MPARSRSARDGLFGARLYLLVVGSGAALVGAALSPAPPPHDIASLAAYLGEAAHAHVEPEDIRWEDSRGGFLDAVSGRYVLFLASKAIHEPRDLFRARVRTSLEGNPFHVADIHNLTATPLGDDHALAVKGAYASFATSAFGQEQSITVLDLSGESAEITGESNEAFAAVMRWLTNFEETGSFAGIGRTDITLDPPARKVALAWAPGARASLAIALDEDQEASRRATFDAARGTFNAGAAGMHAEVARPVAKHPLLWAVDAVRGIPWVGPAPIAWLEDRVFSARDRFRQVAFHLRGKDATNELAARADAATLDASMSAGESIEWPPKSIASIWKEPEPGEGEWIVPKLSWMRKFADAAPPAFFRTFVRPDEERPYVHVLLVAMDMRQLDMDMEAGSEDPKPLTGPHGAGRIPRDPAIYKRVVAAFNGAFKTEHGNYGMMVHRRVLLPPQPNAASIVVLNDARVGFGTWGPTRNVGGISGINDDDIVSFRQNLDPLVLNGQVNPTRRLLWGYTLPGNGTQTERSGICVTGSGSVIYAWSDDISASALGKAMKMAGCAYALHLDMNPHHTGFLFANIQDTRTKNWRSELLSPLMEISQDRYIEYASKDFFYVMLHDPSPPAISGASSPPPIWRVDAGAQPAPRWSPTVWRTSEGDVELVDFEPGRVAWRIRGGLHEPDMRTGAKPVFTLAESDAHRVLLSVSMGVGRERRPRGLVTDGKMVANIGTSHQGAVLVASDDGRLAILRDSDFESFGPRTDATELPLFADGGQKIDAYEPEVPPSGGTHEWRAALGITRTGRVIIARAHASRYAPLIDALLRAGCARIVALDRGEHASGAWGRAGTDTPPRARNDETTLFALAMPMAPRAFVFEAAPVSDAAPPPGAERM